LNKYIERAKKIIEDSSKFQKIADETTEKFHKLENGDNKIQELIRHLKLFIKMVKYHFNGKYRSFSPKSLLLIIAGLIYFITPIDLIPDLIPALGFTDDISVIYFVYKSVKKDIDKFLEWEMIRRQKSQDGD